MPRDLPESLLSEPVSEWLRSLGCTVWAEVPFYRSAIDLVGRQACHRKTQDCMLTAVELKTSLTREAIRQAMMDQMVCDRCWIAVTAHPSDRQRLWCQTMGIGLLRVEGSRVRVMQQAGANRLIDVVERRSFEARLSHMAPGGLAGLPSLPGCGAAQECARAIAAYRRRNPAARWPEIWANVPNHYQSAERMRKAMERVRTIGNEDVE